MDEKNYLCCGIFTSQHSRARRDAQFVLFISVRHVILSFTWKAPSISSAHTILNATCCIGAALKKTVGVQRKNRTVENVMNISIYNYAAWGNKLTLERSNSQSHAYQILLLEMIWRSQELLQHGIKVCLSLSYDWCERVNKTKQDQFILAHLLQGGDATRR